MGGSVIRHFVEILANNQISCLNPAKALFVKAPFLETPLSALSIKVLRQISILDSTDIFSNLPRKGGSTGLRHTPDACLQQQCSCMTFAGRASLQILWMCTGALIGASEVKTSTIMDNIGPLVSFPWCRSCYLVSKHARQFQTTEILSSGGNPCARHGPPPSLRFETLQHR